MQDLTGYYLMDNVDLWTAYKMSIEYGTVDLLRYPPAKEGLTHDWGNVEDGIEVDLTERFFGAREIDLNCWIITETEAEFWTNHQAFIAQMMQPELRRLTVKAHGNKYYDIYYKDCTVHKQVTKLDGLNAGMIAHKFTLKVVEPKPVIDREITYLVDDIGQFIIT